MSTHPDDAKAADAFLDEVREYVDAQQWIPAIPVLALKFRALEAENADLRARIVRARAHLETAGIHSSLQQIFKCHDAALKELGE